jgi:pimeloyl-ACP methyl ester carboxylesterase
MGTISGFHHVKLPVTDVARSGDWYRKVLGFEVALEFVEDGVVRGLALRHPGGVQIALRHDPERAAALAGFDPIALAVPHRAAVSDWSQHLADIGETHAGVVTGHEGGAVLVGLYDPDGIEIRLYADPPPAPELRTLRVGDATIGGTDSGGERDPVLLVHAGVFGAWFAPVAAEPALEGRRVVRMVRAGYTDGPAPDGHLTVADHAAHCAAILDELGGRPASVVGHSSGSVIALQLALDRPDLVRSLVLSEPPLIDALVDPADLPSLHAGMGPVLETGMAAAARGEIDTAYDTFMGLVCGPEHRTVVAGVLGTGGLEQAVRQSAFFFADEVGAVATWTLDESRAAELEQPILLVQGGASPPPTHRLVARLAALLPTATVATVDDANHLLPLSHPNALAGLIVDR